MHPSSGGRYRTVKNLRWGSVQVRWCHRPPLAGSSGGVVAGHAGQGEALLRLAVKPRTSPPGRYGDSVVKVAELVKKLEEPVLLDAVVTSGRLAVLRTTSPRGDVPSPVMGCYAVLTSWRDEPARVGMFVTFVGQAVNLVYADLPKERTLPAAGERQVTAAVAVGRWLFKTGRLREHSPDRNDAGDRWAHAVSEEPCPREKRPQTYDPTDLGMQILAVLNHSLLPAFPSK